MDRTHVKPTEADGTEGSEKLEIRVPGFLPIVVGPLVKDASYTHPHETDGIEVRAPGMKPITMGCRESEEAKA